LRRRKKRAARRRRAIRTRAPRAIPTLAPVERPREVLEAAEEERVGVEAGTVVVVVGDPVTVIIEVVDPDPGRTVFVIDAPRAETMAE
jgi:hypothetical protein